MAHKRVKDIAYDNVDDLEDDDSENGDETQDLTPEDEEQMVAGAVAVRAELEETGSEAMDEKEIRDALWYYYFDVGKSVDYLRRQHEPRDVKVTPKKEKKLSRFEQAAAAAQGKSSAGASHPYHLFAPPTQARNCANYLTAAAFFSDTPFLAIPTTRLGILIPAIEPLRLPGGLLGGSSTGKPSKLAALAASRKKAADEKKKTTSTSAPTDEASKGAESISSVALLEKLRLGKPRGGSEEVAESSKETRENIVLEQPKKRSYPIRENSPEKEPSPEPAPVTEGGPAEIQDERNENAEELIAQPSSFAQTLFAPPPNSRNEYHNLENIADSNAQLFALPYPTAIEKDTASRKVKGSANVDPFSGPSPDDVVLQAQSKAGKNNHNSNTSTPKKLVSSANKIGSVNADELAALKLDDSVSSSTRVKSKNLDVLAEFEKSDMKNAATFVVIGHVDHGKSTLMGRLLHDLSMIPARSFQKLQESSQQAGKASFSFAWLLDTTESERSRGITVDVASTPFSTSKTNFTVLDAPGHKDFVPNMIAGTSQADLAVLVVDSGTDAFETGMEGGGQTKEHALLARALGINRVIVAVNKLDTTTPPWSQARFDTVSQQMAAFLATAGFTSNNIAFVPCAGLTGENVVKRLSGESAPWSWYTGPTLLEQLEITGLDTTVTSKQHIASPLRLTISDIFRASVTAPLSIAARIDAGSLQVGDVVLAMPAGETATIKGLEVDSSSGGASSTDDNASTSRDWVVAGQIITAHLIDIDPIHLRLGDVMCSPHNPIRNVRAFTAKILAFDFVIPGPVDCHRGSMHAEASIESLLAVLDKNGDVEGKKGRKPRVVKAGTVARVRVVLARDLPLEAGARVVLRREGTSVAAGLIELVEAV